MATSQQLATSRKVAKARGRKQSADACQVFLRTLLQHLHQLQLRPGRAVAITLTTWTVLVPTLLTNPWTMQMAAATFVLKPQDVLPSRITWLMGMARRIAT
jgi:hypothetical protein